MKSHRFPLRMVASAVALALPLWAHAAGLGKLTVNSALGQPLSAEIELLAADKSELDSLKANLASGQAFKDAQIEYAAVLSALEMSVEKRTDGRSVLKITSSRAINDPFLDMLIELNWSSGRLVREYTVLLDPPGVAIPQTVSPVAVSTPAITPAPAPAVSPAAPAAKPTAMPSAVSPAKTTAASTKSAPIKSTSKSAPAPKPEPVAQKPAPQPEPQNVAPPSPPPPQQSAAPQETVAEEEAALAKAALERESAVKTPKPQTAPSPASAVSAETIKVKRGDTLAGIANGLKPAEISLEEALVGLFRENPQAFEGKNMNRLKAGAQLKVPSEETMKGLDAKTANREVRLQAADWQAYRAKLAEHVATEPAPEAAKKTEKQVSTGKITSKVEDKAQPKAESKDVLKLSRSVTPPAATVSSAPAKQAQTAADKSAQDKAAAAKQAADKAAADKAAADKAAHDKAIADQEERTAREKATKEAAERAAMLEKQIADMQKLAQMKDAAPANAVPAASPANKGAQTPPPPATPKLVAKPPVEQPQTSWVDGLKSNPLYWLGGLAIVALGGALWWMMSGGKRRKNVTAEFDDSLLSGGDLSPNTVIGEASGGTVNTGDTSFLTDFSQAGLAAVDTHDVDPIAEADVYMAYGRDAQAEEILREALTKSPDRHEIRLKLLEIHAARKNVTGFEKVAGELYAALGGQTGTIWDKATEMGRSIDPGNPLYGGDPNAIAAATPVPAPAPAPEQLVVEPFKPEKTESAGGILDFNLDAPDEKRPPEPANVPVLKPEDPTTIGHTLDFDLSGLDIGEPDTMPKLNLNLEEAAPSAPASMDFSGLDLNLEDMGADEEMDEIATKLDLARAYLEMGDKEGAREILQEVLNEGNDSQKTDARSIMSGL